jgi:nucleotide-binding universal stress UspA family protein
LDGSLLAEQVLPFVAFLASGFKAHVKLLHIIDREGVAWIPDEHRAYLNGIQQEADMAARNYLAERARHLGERGVDVNTSIVYGKPADVLQAYGEGTVEPEDVIALSTHGRSGLGSLFLGSVADRMLHTSRFPLLLIRPKAGAPPETVSIKTIVVPLDGSPEAEYVLPLATQAASELGLSVRLLSVAVVTGGLYVGPQPVGFPPYIVQTVKQNAEAYLQRIAQPLQREGIEVTQDVLLHRSPRSAIVGMRAQANSMIAMTFDDRWVGGCRQRDAPSSGRRHAGAGGALAASRH